MTHSPHQFDDDAASDDMSDDTPDDAAIGDIDADDGAPGAADAGAVADSVDELKKVLAAELSTDTTQHYLNQIGTRALLTAPQEVHFATRA